MKTPGGISCRRCGPGFSCCQDPQSGTHYFELLKMLIRESEVMGNLVFDAQIAAVCREHGITKLLTDDKDFLRFKDGIETISPAAEPAEL